ncbi:hypothetical protein [Tautonia plasticadhaerens]|uniref:hypothetical protein n=1 Tax=Tautonia plasticadhaerens TaxID=2527974 RepID=UPI0018D2732D|nr:hypothetical protein [Tautonia plasticadhaerens]
MRKSRAEYDQARPSSGRPARELRRLGIDHVGLADPRDQLIGAGRVDDPAALGQLRGQLAQLVPPGEGGGACVDIEGAGPFELASEHDHPLDVAEDDPLLLGQVDARHELVEVWRAWSSQD